MSHSKLRPPPTLPGLLATLLLLGMLVFFAPCPALAGSWLMHVALTPGVQNNGIAKASPKLSQTWTQPTDATNSITVGSIARGAGSSTSSVTATTVLSVTLTATWQATGGDSASDPAPTSVMVLETASAYANYTQTGANGAAGTTMIGTVDDGLGQGDTPDANGNISGTKYATCPVQGGSFTLPLAPTATASASPGPSGTDSSTGLSYIGTCTASAGIGPLSLAIHAQPYNFRRIPGAGVIGTKPDGTPNGEIDYAYAYSSTDGNPADLTTCTWHEHLTFSGGQVGTQATPNKYYPPSPPFGYPASGTAWFNNPDFGTDYSMVPSPAGSAPEIDDRIIVPAFLKPYTYGTYSATQVFEFNDSATGDKNVQIPGPDSGPFTIVRTVKYVDPTHYEYDVSKASVSNTLSLPD